MQESDELSVRVYTSVLTEKNWGFVVYTGQNLIDVNWLKWFGNPFLVVFGFSKKKQTLTPIFRSSVKFNSIIEDDMGVFGSGYIYCHSWRSGDIR